MPVVHRRLLISLALLMATLLASAQDAEVRVLLERVDHEIRFEVTEAHRGLVDGLQIFDTPLGITWPIRVDRGSLLIDGAQFGRSLTLAPRSATVVWGGHEYRGALQFVANGDELLVINVVGLEEYLRGVVPAEMMAAWPLEALKAQAVASRTYTILSLGSGEAFDICATVECQRYAGVASEHLRSDRAVAETSGLVLTYRGEPARTYYHADSGGALASSAEVWGRALPYLASRNDVTALTPHRRWRRALDPYALSQSLSGLGYRIGAVEVLRVTSYSDSGRAERAEIIGSQGTAVLAGANLTALLRGVGLKSTRFKMVGQLTAQGDGWGHGVGMSQYGARTLAESGYGFEQILRFYYPDTMLQRLAALASR